MKKSSQNAAVDNQGQSLDDDLAHHAERVHSAAVKTVQAVQSYQARRTRNLSKKHPCKRCGGEGILETLTFYSRIGGPSGEVEFSNGEPFGAVGAARCMTCEGSGIDYEAAGASKMAEIVKLVKA